MHTDTDHSLPLLRLMHLVSPSLPVGGFTYSQGIEWAVERGWIRDVADLEGWLDHQLHHALALLDLPVLVRLQRAVADDDIGDLQRWTGVLLAGRETSELRLEEANRGRALADLLVALGLGDAVRWRPTLCLCQAAGFAFAAARWRIDRRDTLLGYAWNWLENLVLAAVKIIPLGQTEGQRLLHRLLGGLPGVADTSLALDDEGIGASTPALAIASSRHESQYTRLFRS